MLIPVRAEEPPQVWMDRQKNLSPQKKETEVSFFIYSMPSLLKFCSNNFVNQL
jgi:hypothetical protein